MREYLKIAFAWCLAITLVPVLTATAFFALGPSVETRLLPVISEVKAVPVQVDTDREIIHIAALGTKVRQCEWKAITAMVYKNGQWQQGSVYFTDPRLEKKPQQALTTSRPVGSQSLGEIFIFPTGQRVQVYLYHDCHPLWQTTTFLYELDFSKSPNQVR